MVATASLQERVSATIYLLDICGEIIFFFNLSLISTISKQSKASYIENDIFNCFLSLPY